MQPERLYAAFEERPPAASGRAPEDRSGSHGPSGVGGELHDRGGSAVLSVGPASVLPGVAEGDARAYGCEEIAMSRFLVTYHGAGAPAPEQMEQARAAFGAW